MAIVDANYIDFVDCLLYSYNVTDNEKIFTFDKQLNNLLNK